MMGFWAGCEKCIFLKEGDIFASVIACIFKWINNLSIKNLGYKNTIAAISRTADEWDPCYDTA